MTKQIESRAESRLTVSKTKKKLAPAPTKKRRALRGIDALMGAMAAPAVAEGLRRRKRAARDGKETRP
jgi:hypothetical protein